MGKNSLLIGKKFPLRWEKSPTIVGTGGTCSLTFLVDYLYTINQAIENRFTISHENGTN